VTQLNNQLQILNK